MQRLFQNPGVLKDLLDQQIEGFHRLVDRALKKRPESVKEEEAEKVLAVGV